MSLDPRTRALVGGLREGGYVLYFRHAATDTAIETESVDLQDCSTQRNLSERGRRQSIQIGRSVDQLGIRVGTVLASGYCRTMDTAVLAFGRAEATEALLSLPEDPGSSGVKRSRAALKRLLATSPEPSTNTVLVSHAANIQEVAGVILDEGEAAVFLPRGRGRSTLVGRITPDQWVAAASVLRR